MRYLLIFPTFLMLLLPSCASVDTNELDSDTNSSEDKEEFSWPDSGDNLVDALRHYLDPKYGHNIMDDGNKISDGFVELYHLLLSRSTKDNVYVFHTRSLDLYDVNRPFGEHIMTLPKNIDDYNIFLIPNHNEGVHWTLHVAVLENNSIKLGYIDPFGSAPKQADTDKVISILQYTFNGFGKTIDRVSETPYGTVGMQRNGYDCGMFLMYYVRKIKELGRFDMSQLTIRQQDILSFRAWIKKEVIHGGYLPGFTIK